jgi:hypothetical protein
LHRNRPKQGIANLNLLQHRYCDKAPYLVRPKYCIYDDIFNGQLVPVLNTWNLPRVVINLA